MKKSYIYSMAATFITAALALGSFTACSNEDIVADQQTATQAQTYTVSIPASMGDEGTVVYTAVIPEDGLTWQLPTDITGDYIIRLIHGNWTFVGDIEL